MEEYSDSPMLGVVLVYNDKEKGIYGMQMSKSLTLRMIDSSFDWYASYYSVILYIAHTILIGLVLRRTWAALFLGA